MASALLMRHVPFTGAKHAPHSTWPRAQGKGLPPSPATHKLFRKWVCVWDDDHQPNGKHLGPAESASPIKTAGWVLLHEGACASRSASQALVLDVQGGQGRGSYCDCAGEEVFPLSVFIFFLLLLMLINTYSFLIKYFAVWFSQNRCNQQ